MGQDKRHRDNQRSKLDMWKNCKIEKNYTQIPRRKSGKTLIAKVSHLISTAANGGSQ